VEVVGPASHVRHVEGHVELRRAERQIRRRTDTDSVVESREREGFWGMAYGLSEVVEVDGGEAE
jgi:hypothetical protein